MKTLKLTVIAAAATMLCCCTQNQSEEHKVIAPMASGIKVGNMQDCTVPATFSVDSFDWMGGNLTMTVYSQDLYDAVEVSRMQVGDTLIYDSKPMVINTIDNEGDGITINGGLEQGGCWLVGNEGGTYVARVWDDHTTYTELGKAQLPLAEDFVIINCGMNPDDPVDTIRTGQKLYIEKLKADRKDFFLLNTRVTVEKGVITEVNRRWIP